VPAGLAEVVVGGFVLVEVEFEFEGESEVGSGEAVAAETEAGGGGAQQVLGGEQEELVVGVGGGGGLQQEQEDGGAEPAGGLGGLSHSQEYLADVVVEPWPPHILLIVPRLGIYLQGLPQTPLRLLLLPPPKPQLGLNPQTLALCVPSALLNLPHTLLIPAQPIQTQYPLKQHLFSAGALHHIEALQSQLGVVFVEEGPAEFDAGGEVSIDTFKF
jgi:hypothetical protein